MFSDRAQAIAEVIRPALDAGQIILCDRFTDSTEAYQGGGRQLGSEVVLELHRLLCGGLTPGLTILLLPDFEASLARARSRQGNEGRLEKELDAFYHRVFDKYREIAAREPNRVVIVDSNGSIDDVHEEVVRILAPVLAGRLFHQQVSRQPDCR
jgi:dTMP kinase